MVVWNKEKFIYKIIVIVAAILFFREVCKYSYIICSSSRGALVVVRVLARLEREIICLIHYIYKYYNLCVQTRRAHHTAVHT
jgi:hypothetical protein